MVNHEYTTVTAFFGQTDMFIMFQVRKIGLGPAYDRDLTVQAIVCRLGSLQVVPLQYVDHCFTIIVNMIPTNDAVQNWPIGTVKKLHDICAYYRLVAVNHRACRRMHYCKFDGSETGTGTHHCHQLRLKGLPNINIR
jgi:hypothetical protein